jgi:predicted O-methyltransferase YrrM
MIRSRHRKGHGIHSPYAYDFVSNVIFDKTKYPEYNLIKHMRNELLTSDISLPAGKYGAGSVLMGNGLRKLKDIVIKSSVLPKFGELLFRIAKYYKPSFIIELGTSIGISTLYLVKGAPGSRIVTIEGNTSVCEFAQSLFNKHQLNTIEIINELFDDCLSGFDNNYPPPGLVFIDGNHACEPVLRYFNYFSKLIKAGFLIIDDINWSYDMRKAWKIIKMNPVAKVTIDLFFMGIVIFQKSITPGHYTIRF